MDVAGVPAITNCVFVLAYDTADTTRVTGNRTGVAAQLHKAQIPANNAADLTVTLKCSLVETAGNCTQIDGHDSGIIVASAEIGVGHGDIFYQRGLAGNSKQTHTIYIFIVEIQAGNALSVTIEGAAECGSVVGGA